MERNYKIKAIKTNYNGILFRSKTEARWAVFFDSLGVEYRYEPYYEEVGNDYLSFNYLPDFYLQQQDIYIEIKPGKPCHTEERKAAFWCKDIHEIVILFNLNPPTEKLENGWLYYFPNIKQISTVRDSYWWGECPKCGHIDIAEYAYITSCGCHDIDFYNNLFEKEEVSGMDYSKKLSRSKRLMKAYSNAKNYKFKPGHNDPVKKIQYQSSLF